MSLAEGTYKIEAFSYPESVLDYVNIGPEEACLLFAFKSSTVDKTQEWKVTKLDDTSASYTIQNVTSGQYISPKDPDAPEEGTHVVTEQSKSTWKIHQINKEGNYVYRIQLPNVHLYVGPKSNSSSFAPLNVLSLSKDECDDQLFDFVKV